MIDFICGDVIFLRYYVEKIRWRKYADDNVVLEIISFLHGEVVAKSSDITLHYRKEFEKKALREYVEYLYRRLEEYPNINYWRV